jgi:hypothetical protein
MIFDFPGSGTMRISRPDYPPVQEDGNGMDGVTNDLAYWTVCSLPRDAHGNVAGWFMSFDTRAVLVDSLADGIWAIVAISLR